MKEVLLKFSIFVSGFETKSATHIQTYDKRNLQLRLILSLVAIISIFHCSCAPTRPIQPNVPAFNNTALITTLERGISTSTEVRKILGEPTGKGGFLYPTDTDERIVWYYEHLKISGVSTEKIDIQQDVLMVFLKEDKFDGFLWFSDASKKW